MPNQRSHIQSSLWLCYNRYHDSLFDGNIREYQFDGKTVQRHIYKTRPFISVSIKPSLYDVPFTSSSPYKKVMSDIRTDTSNTIGPQLQVGAYKYTHESMYCVFYLIIRTHILRINLNHKLALTPTILHLFQWKG